MWSKIGLLVTLVSLSFHGGSAQTIGSVIGDAVNAMKSGQTSLFQTLLPGVSPMAFFTKTVAKAIFARKENQTMSGVVKQEFEQLMQDTLLTNVSQPCFNAFVFSLTSITGVLTGTFPVDVANMFDASGKSVSGTMRGAVMRKGNYHQCIKVHLNKELTEAIEGLEDGFVGKYCQVNAEYGPGLHASNSDEDAYCERFPEPHGFGESEAQSRLTDNACLVQQDYKDEHIYPLKTKKPFQIALCVPSVCTVDDVHSLFNTVSQMHNKDLRIRDVKCRQKDQQTLSVWSICVICICSLLALTILLATIYDIWLGFQVHEDPVLRDEKRKNAPQLYQPGFLGQNLLCFSVQRNLAFILNHQPDSKEEVLPSVNGVRSLTLLWVIGTNLLLVAKDRPWVNYVGLLEDLRKWPMQIFINGRFAADTSFCIGGILAAYLMLKRLSEQRGGYAIYSHYLHRYLRLTPALLLMMLLASGIYPLSADGPDWIDGQHYEDACLKHWWKGLLLINNFYNGSESCPPVSWYLATDMQLHLIAPFLIYPLHSFPGLGLTLLGTALVAFMAIPGLITASQSLPYFMGRLFYLEPHHDKYTFHVLMKPWTHAGPFLVGILVGYLLHRNAKRATPSTAVVILGWLMAIAVKSMIIFGFHPYIDGTVKMTTVTGILYTTLTPSLWAAATGWIIFACVTNNGGIVRHILSWGTYDVIARVSYCAYLLNFLAIFHYMQSRADSFYYDTCNLMVMLTGTVITTIISAVVLSTVIERPFLELQKLWFETGFRSYNPKITRNKEDSDEDNKTSKKS